MIKIGKIQAFLSTLLIFLCLSFTICFAELEEKSNEEPLPTEQPTEEKLEYAKGSVCGYCHYCTFCKLCDKDCPCEKTQKKPNCHMCKYCKYCHLCSALCDTICKPGGVLDKVSSAIVNSLPSFDKSEVENDLKTVAEWTKRKDEL